MSGRYPDLISVILPAVERAGDLTAVLAGLADQTLPARSFEVIVVGSLTSPALPAAVERATDQGLTVQLIDGGGAGLAAARNLALHQARGDIVLFLEGDTWPERELLAEHRRSHHSRQLAVVGALAWHPDLAVTPLMRLAGELLQARQQITADAEDAPLSAFLTVNSSVDREAALAIGLFDEQAAAGGHEDTDFAYRLRRAGVRFVVNQAARARWLQPLTLADLLQRERLAGYQAVWAWSRHPELDRLTRLYRVVSEADECAFYEAAARYSWLIGAAQALGRGGQTSAGLEAVKRHLATPPDLADWRDEYLRQADQQSRTTIRRQQATIESLRRRVEQAEAQAAEAMTQLEQDRTWAADLERKANQQAEWAGQLQQQLDELTRGSLLDQLKALLKRARS